MDTNRINDLRSEEEGWVFEGDIASKSTDSLLESLALPIMESSILEQITGSLNTNRDFLSTVLEKFRIIDENADADSVRGIRSEITDWANHLIVAIVHQYGLGYNNVDEDTLESLDTLEAMYHFFVLDRHDNTIEFFKQYIDTNKSRITATLNIAGRGTDITSNANRKKNLSKHDVAILSNMDEVIRFISSGSGVTSYEMLDLIDDGDYYIARVHSLFQEDILAGDFFADYIAGDVGVCADDISIELRSTIRTHLAKM